ncbi:MAG: hypothetical protein R2911_36630 [Caldilineaceae bacterium]
MLNISTIGLTAQTGELGNLDYCDVDICCKLIDLNRDLLLGVKVRIDKNTTRGQGVEPLRRARAAADRCEMPLMTHIGYGPPTLPEVLEFMRPGDILTHCFTGGDMRIVDDNGRLPDDAACLGCWRGHGHYHGGRLVLLQTAQAMIDAGYQPDRSHRTSTR